MEKFLIIYGTTEGYTQKVAEHIARAIRAHGFVADVYDCEDQEADLEGSYDGILVGASVHAGTHQAAVAQFVKNNLPLLQSAPSVFFSVSLNAALPDPEHQATAQQYVDAFLTETGWQPDHTWRVAGALRYTHYGFAKRLMMKVIARREGYSTDTSKDHEYTDWYALDRRVEYFLANAYAPYAHVDTE